MVSASLKRLCSVEWWGDWWTVNMKGFGSTWQGVTQKVCVMCFCKTTQNWVNTAASLFPHPRPYLQQVHRATNFRNTMSSTVNTTKLKKKKSVPGTFWLTDAVVNWWRLYSEAVRKTTKNSSVAGTPVVIRTRHLPQTKSKLRCYTNHFDFTHVKLPVLFEYERRDSGG